VELRRLFPDQAVTTVADAAGGLDFGARAPAERPFIALNMVSSADGKATLQGKTAPMSATADRELFHRLRAQADGILVGAGTVRVERYGRVTKTPELQAVRAAAGVRPEALAVIVSRSGDLPPELGVMEGARVIADVAELGALRNEGIRSLLCEGGPTLNASLFAAGLVDELFLTIAPAVAGAGEGLTIVEGGPLPDTVGLELLTVHEAGGHLFLRYRVS
jgi:riboflavin biosynthesis pyrimidine reductase